MAILRQATMANFNKITIMAVLVWVDMTKKVVHIYAKNRKNVNNLQKHRLKSHDQNKIFCKKKKGLND